MRLHVKLDQLVDRVGRGGRQAMTVNKVLDLLDRHGFTVTTIRKLPNGTGHQIRTSCGRVVNVYNSGKIVVQGKEPEPLQDLINSESAGKPQAPAATRNVFVVYGHDRSAKDQLEAMLRRWGLEPLFLDQLPSEGRTIIEKLEEYRHQAGYAIVLATPDDEGYRAGHPDEKAFRARQNVVLELGMMLAILGRQRVAILIKEPDKMERPSDIQGLIYIPFRDRVEEAQVQLAREMVRQGYSIDIERL